jgi:hypothetical protein
MLFQSSSATRPGIPSGSRVVAAVVIDFMIVLGF